MNIRQFEDLIIYELQQVIEDIIQSIQELNISAKSRSGAEISDWIEEQFVEFTKEHKYFKRSEYAPKGKTKNPWDARTYFVINDLTEEIWIDFKAIKISGLNSNPDIGTPDKVVNFIKEGHFYLVYVYIYYQAKGSKLEFVKSQSGETYSKVYFLKDISSTVRRNPKNQLQVNVSEPPVYRSREQFILLLIDKLRSSYQRQINISEKKLKELDKVYNELIEANNKSESEIMDNLERLN